jgi:hypothetical protein
MLGALSVSVSYVLLAPGSVTLDGISCLSHARGDEKTLAGRKVKRGLRKRLNPAHVATFVLLC